MPEPAPCDRQQTPLICQQCGAYYVPTSGAGICPQDGGKLVPAQTETLIGSVVGDRYLVMNIIGVGGWGTVYKATDKSTETHVAVKVMHRHLCSNVESVKRFAREAQALSSLNHENLTQIVGTGFLPTGQPYIAMELLSGKSLASIIEEEERITSKRLVAIVKQTCDALVAAHAKGIVHRDLKPAHIMLMSGDHVKVVDFGLAKVESSGNMTALTQTGQTVGTPDYMSPEQCMGVDLDARSDIYSIGLIMFEALTGRKAVEAATIFEAMQKHVAAEFLPLSEVRTDIAFPPRLEQIVAQCLQKDPSKRFASCEALSTALGEVFTAGGGTSTTSISRVSSVEKVIKSGAGVWIGGLAGASLVALVAFGISQFHGEKKELPPLKKSVETAPVEVLQQSLQNTKPAPVVPLAVEAVAPVEKSVLAPQVVLPKKPASAKPVIATVPEPRRPAVQTPQSVPDPDDGAALIPKSVSKTEAAPPIAEAAKVDGLGRVVLTYAKDDPLIKASLAAIANPDDVGAINLSYSACSDETVNYCLHHFKKLRGLNLNYTPITDAAFANPPGGNLQNIYLAGTRISGKVLRDIAQIRSMKALIFSDNQITDKDLDALEGTHIRHLQLSRTEITDACAPRLLKMPSLRLVNLHGTQFTDAGLQALASSNLSGLALASTNVTDDGMQYAAQMPALRDLVLSATPVSDAGLEKLTGSRSLRLLDLRGTKVSSNFAAVVARIKPLQAIVAPRKLLTAENRKILGDAGIRVVRSYAAFGRIRYEDEQSAQTKTDSSEE